MSFAWSRCPGASGPAGSGNRLAAVLEACGQAASETGSLRSIAATSHRPLDGLRGQPF